VTIGETLAEARRRAGLTVSEVSHQTRIRETIIRGIEQDDYSGCGGDFYARGHIRAVARAVGADPAPLIQEFDETNWVLHGSGATVDATGNVRMDPAPGEPGGAAHRPSVFDPIPPGGGRPGGTHPPGQPHVSPRPGEPYEPAEPGYDGQPGPAPESAARPGRPDTAYWLPSVFDAVDQVPSEPEADRVARRPPPRQSARPAPRSYQAPRRPPPPRPSRDREAGGSWLSSVFDSAPENPGEITEPNGLRPAAPATAERPPKRENRVAIVAVAALAVVGLLAYLLTNVFSSNSPGTPRSGAAPSQSSHPRATSSSPAPTPSRSPTAPVTPAVVTQTLHPASAEAFGPNGAGQGDNTSEAAQAIDHSLSSAWASDWYSTSHFGNLQPGTGLLLNMGRTVRITSAEITLGSTPGADVQLRAGSSPSLTALRTVARASNAGGTVHLRISNPAHAHYLLIWFTGLPPDSTGTYQVKVYNVALKGTR